MPQVRIATANLESVSNYSQSKFLQQEKVKGERPDQYEERCWRDRIHCAPSGECFIPPMCFKKSLQEAAQFLSRPVPGKGKATFTKHFKAGTLVTEPLYLGVQYADVPGEWLLVSADGKPNGSTRVKRCFPLFESWSGDVQFMVIDPSIDEETFLDTLETAGQMIGIGRFRPINGGFYGRFKVNSVNWSEY